MIISHALCETLCIYTMMLQHSLFIVQTTLRLLITTRINQSGEYRPFMDHKSLSTVVYLFHTDNFQHAVWWYPNTNKCQKLVCREKVGAVGDSFFNTAIKSGAS